MEDTDENATTADLSDVLLNIVDNSRNLVQAEEYLKNLQASDRQKKMLQNELNEYYKDSIQDSYTMRDQITASNNAKTNKKKAGSLGGGGQ